MCSRLKDYLSAYSANWHYVFVSVCRLSLCMFSDLCTVRFLSLLHPVGVQVLLSTRLSVCLCVCEHISGTAGPIVRKFCLQIPCGCGSILLWRRCATLCTSGFTDDVTFGRSGPYGVAWPSWSAILAVSYVHDRGGVWCLWMLVFAAQQVNNCSSISALYPSVFSVALTLTSVKLCFTNSRVTLSVAPRGKLYPDALPPTSYLPESIESLLG